MSRFVTRVAIFFTGVYFLVAYYYAQYYGVDILDDWYCLIFEACVTVHCFSEGRYHCRYMRGLSLMILLSDSLTRLDNAFSFLSVSAHNLIPITLISFGFLTTICLALHHFYRVSKIKGRKNGKQ